MILKIAVPLTLFLFAMLLAPLACGQEPVEEKPRQELPPTVEQLERMEAEAEKLAKQILEIKPAEIKATDDELRKLLKERYNAAVEAMQPVRIMYENSLVSFDQVVEVGRLVMHSGLELFEDPKPRVQLLTNYVAIAKMYEGNVKQKFRGMSEDKVEMSLATYHRAEAEILLNKEKRKVLTKPAK